MKIKKTLIASVLAVALLGCGKQQPRHFIIMPDVSGSIERESLEQAFKAVDEFASHLQRGDRLTIIPILGDAEAEASGKILRFEVPANRQAYDTDLRDFRSKLDYSLKTMEANAVAHPGAKTDILGSIILAEQEFEAAESKSQKVLLILSDFIEEDNEINFRKDGFRKHMAIAYEYALYIAKQKQLNFKEVQIYLGLVKSNQYSAMPRSKRNAISEFWIRLFQSAGAKTTIRADGINIILHLNQCSTRGC